MNIIKVAEGAFFVSSYSEQTIAPAYSTGTSVQTFGEGLLSTEEPSAEGQQKQADRNDLNPYSK